MDRWIAPIVAAVLALVVGFGIGALVYADDEADTTTTAPETTPAPTAVATDDGGNETCLAALEEVEQDVEAEQRVADLVDEYENIIGRSAMALSDFDTRRLEELLSEVEDLNERSERLIDETRTTDVSAAIETCRSVLGVPE